MSANRLRLNWGNAFYADSGGDGSPLLFLHGTGCDSRDWDRVVAKLPGARAVRMDFRGHGRSDVSSARFTLDDLAEDSLALIDRLDLTDVLLVGHSLGGMVAMAAASRSDRVGGLVLLEGWTRLRGVNAFGPGRFYGGLDRRRIEAIRRKDAKTRARFDPAAWAHFWESVEAFDASEFLASARIPVLEVYGARGRIGSTRARLMIPDNPRIRLEWIPDSGHYLPHERPDDVARLCLRAL
jgi:3-oxoadipate enol-lactonase